MLHRALLKTHHMTSRKKIHAITKATKSLSCAVVLKTGRPPGVMIAECECGNENQEFDGKGKKENSKRRVAGEGEERLREWVSAVKRLRYKDFQLLALERVPLSFVSVSQPHQPHLHPYPNPHPNPRVQPRSQARLPIPAGHIKEITEMKLLRAYLDECGISSWWTARMGFSIPAER